MNKFILIKILIFSQSIFMYSQESLTKVEKWKFIEKMIIDSPRCRYNLGSSSTYEIVEDDFETLRIKYSIHSGTLFVSHKVEIILDLNNVKETKIDNGLNFTESTVVGGNCNYKAYVILNEPTKFKRFWFDKDFNQWILKTNVEETVLLFYFEHEFDRDKFMRYVKSFN